jgi:glycine amidinotransferase
MPGTIFVESEFAPLKTVVLAESEFGWPPKKIGRKDTVDFSVTDPDVQRRWEGERAAFETVLKKHGVEVLRPRKLNAAEKAAGNRSGYANFFIRDPFFTIGDTVIEGSLRFPHRRREIFPVREIMLEKVYPADCAYVAAPAPEVDDGTGEWLGRGPFIEGGDTLVLGKRVFVGVSGLATNDLGVRWLQKLLAPAGYDVEAVPLHKKMLHLDCGLGLVRDGLLVFCPDALPAGLPESLKSWDKIEVSFDQAQGLATNGLPIRPDLYVTDPAFRSVGSELEKRGVEVEYVDYAISRWHGGAFRCSVQPLLRKS